MTDGALKVRLAGATAATAAALFFVVGCASPEATNADGGYVSADGVVEQFAVAGREDAPSFEGETIDGSIWSSGDFAGQVMVVNFWYASCPPCRIEAPMLADLDATYEEVEFIGVNVRDSAPAAAAFDEEFGIQYPSILDADDGMVQLAWAGGITPSAVPTTIVIARDGGIAARIVGAIPEQGVLATLIEDELAR